MSLDLTQLDPCFQGIIPSILCTCSRDGIPNVTYISQVYLVDSRHVALSCQFFNKTKRNIAENPHATVIVYDPVTIAAYKLRLRFERSEVEGPLFETMSLRIEVIASHTGMSGVFRLLSSDLYEVVAAEEIEGFLLPPDPTLDASSPVLTSGPLTELRGVQVISQQIARAGDLETLLTESLRALDELLGFSFSMILVPADTESRLVALAARGYPQGGIGAEVAWGQSFIGAAARSRRIVKVAGMSEELRYGRAIRTRMEECGEQESLGPETPLPGLVDAQVQLAIPLLAHDDLVGVLAVESRDPLAFDEWDETFLRILANQIAMGMDRLQGAENDPGSDPVAADPDYHLLYYRCDDCIFVNGEYLIRNVPARILWKILTSYRDDGRREFTNRELRLDPNLGLPPIKDNLESRLILLRKRLELKCPGLRLVSVGRGRFALEIDGPVRLESKDHA